MSEISLEKIESAEGASWSPSPATRPCPGFQVQDDERRDELIVRVRARLAEDGYLEPEIRNADFFIPDL